MSLYASDIALAIPSRIILRVCGVFIIFSLYLLHAYKRRLGAARALDIFVLYVMRQPVRCAGMEICQCSFNLKIVSL